MSGKPWSATRSGFEDTTRRRIEVRMAYLGLSHEALGIRLGEIDYGAPLSGSTVRAYLSGKRAWRRSVPGIEAPEPIERFALALGVPVASLEPGGPWGPLVQTEAFNERLMAAPKAGPGDAYENIVRSYP